VRVFLRRSKKPEPELGVLQLDELIQAARTTGHVVELREDGTCCQVAPAVNTAASQIVQEALANARLFAGGAPVTVVVRYEDDAVELSVANSRGAAWNGRGRPHGLNGMRESARDCGGSLEAGPDGRGGFIVRARLPREPLGA